MSSMKIALCWLNGPVNGKIEVKNGKLVSISSERQVFQGNSYKTSDNEHKRLLLEIDGCLTGYGINQTIVTVKNDSNPFTFFLRDVNSEYPMLIREYGVAVTTGDDGRSYAEINKNILSRGLKNKLEKIEEEPEENFKNAAVNTRNMQCPAWLGISRDMRIFEVDFNLGTNKEVLPVIYPRHAGQPGVISDKQTPVLYSFAFSRGSSCVKNLSRRLEDDCLPILHVLSKDDEVIYEMTMFASLEKSELKAENVRGSHFLVADSFGNGGMQTETQKEAVKQMLPDELEQEEIVLYMNCEVTNTDSVPRYGWFKGLGEPDFKDGIGPNKNGLVSYVMKIDNVPAPNEELSLLLKPGEKVQINFFIPHKRISMERASALLRQDFNKRHRECINFWRKKLDDAMDLNLPEKRIENMYKAGLLHLDLVTYGLEPDKTLTPTIGVYSSIGSESSPIVQFFDSAGKHKIAERSLQYFLDKQHENGFIQNFGGYMLETGAALWSMGEHYRYTRDIEWVKSIKDKLLKSCSFILDWRERNKKEEFRGKGYGMINGKIADPEDHFHQFMLNSYSYVGMKRVAEMIESIDPAEAQKLKNELEIYRSDIIQGFLDALANSPLVPLGDGTWAPSLPSWAEAENGPRYLHAKEKKSYTHYTFTLAETIGLPELVYHEVMKASNKEIDMMLKYLTDVISVRNVRQSQPYYSGHYYVHLRRNEVKAFLKAYYNTFASLADRETFTFWEHYTHVSPHKTHEESWFLMQTRWMLYFEENEKTLSLFRGIPRDWLTHGKKIEVKKASSYFGNINFSLKSEIKEGRMEVSVESVPDRQPYCLKIRIPHPANLKPSSVSTGTYDPFTETITLEKFAGNCNIVVRF